MKLKVTDDAKAPVAVTFAAITDFAAIETELRDAGFEITRTGAWLAPHVGAGWTGRGEFRGKVRQFEAQITEIEDGRMIALEGRVGGLRLHHETRLVPLGEQVTRVNVATDLRPSTISARLLVQSLKLARGQVLKRMQKRLSKDIKRVEARAAAT